MLIDGAREPAPDVRQHASRSSAVDAAATAVRQLGRSRVQHRDVPLGPRSRRAVRASSCGAAAGRPAVCAVRRRAESGARARAGRARDASRTLRAVLWRLARRLGVRQRRHHRRTSRGSAGFIDIVTSLEEAPTTLADEASYREFVTTVIYNPHLARLARPGARARLHRRDHRAAAQDRSALHAGLLAAQHEGRQAMTHPSVIRPARSRRLLRRKMGKTHDLRVGRACSSASMRSSRARSTRCMRMRVMDKVYPSSRAKACSSSTAASCRCAPAICWSRRKACRTACATPAQSRLLVLAILAGKRYSPARWP